MQNSLDNDAENLEELGTTTQPVQKTKSPSLYKVILLNDDFTPRDFVVYLLKSLFSMSESKATEVMLEIHQKGSGVAGIYSFEIAETKCFLVHQYANSHQYPLKCTLEKSS